MNTKIASLPCLICIVLCIFLFEIMEMFPSELSFSYTFYSLVPIVLVAASFIYIVRNSGGIVASYSRSLIIYLVMAYVLSIVHGGYQTTAQYLTFFAPILLYYVSSIAVSSTDNENVYQMVLLALFVTIAYYYFTNFSKNIVIDFEYQDNAAYTLLYFLPIILCVKKNVLKICGIVIILIAMIFSMKRGGLIAFALAVLVYYLIYSLYISSQNKSRIRILLTSIIALGLFFYIFNYYDSVSGNAITSRFQSIEADQGSGRVEIWNWIFDSYGQNGSLFSTILGHGWNAVYRDSGIRSAHNDFLEILYDFGVIAVFIYITFYIKLIKYSFLLIKRKSEYAAPLGAFVVLMLTNSMVSHIITYPKYMILFTLVLGYIIPSSLIHNKINN